MEKVSFERLGFYQKFLRNSFIAIAIFLPLFSCENKLNCNREEELFLDSWKEEVVSTYRYKKYKASYIIETKSGKKIRIAPKKPIINLASPGDSIFKEKYSFETILITQDKYHDTFVCRLTSVSCDSIVESKYKPSNK